MIAKVLVEISNINIDKTFSYLVPESLYNKILIGVRVTVPFNNRLLEGFVLDIINENDSTYELKTIVDIIDDEPILDEELLELGSFMSKKYFSTLISSYQTMLPKALKAKNKTKINKKIVKYVKLSKNEIKEDINDSQKKIINILKTNGLVLLSELNKVSASSVKTLIKKEYIKLIEKEEFRYNTNIEMKKNIYTLTTEQEFAKNTILTSKDKVFLLHGVTGSGKTLVYMELVEEMLNAGKDSIFLVPEISLTPQMVNQFKERFGNLVAVLHSGLSDGERYDEYRKIKNGDVRIVVGARSAIFAPFKNIGIIIIDEEHTTTYKQDSNPKYSAIDIAIERARYHNSKVVLGSATPSLDSYARALKGVYKLVELKNRVANRKMPIVEIVDLNKEFKKTGIFSKKMVDEINNTISNGEQVILLLNRRGYSSFLSCLNCGNVIKCPNCDITLTYHKSSNTLRCHYCGYGERHIEVCPNCHEKSMKNLGIGTEQIEELINNTFNAKVVRMDLDTTSRKGAHEKIIESFRNKEYDILLGTQMISKGLDFSNVTLVGVINADTSLMLPNYKSSEYTFQLLMQTAGRSGRGNIPGKVIIQTFNPDHYAIFLAKTHDYKEFFRQEMNIRRKLSYPPYYFLTYIRIIGKDYDLISKESNKIGNKLKNELRDSVILGPTTCSVFKVKNEYRFGITIKYKKEDNLYRVLNLIVDHYRENRFVKIDIDMNPNSF